MGGPGAAGESKPLRRPDVRASVGGPSVGTEAAASSGVVAEGERGVAGGGERPGEARKSQPTCEAKRLGPEEATGQGLGWTGRLAWCGRPGHGAREKPWSLGQKGVRAEALPSALKTPCASSPSTAAQPGDPLRPQHLSTPASRAPGSRLPPGLATGVLETCKRLASCVGRESNPGQLLGRQLCSPLYHQRCTARAAPRRTPRVRPRRLHPLWSPPLVTASAAQRASALPRRPAHPQRRAAARASSGRPPSHPRQPHAAGRLRGPARLPANRLWGALAPPGRSWYHPPPPTPLLPAGKPRPPRSASFRPRARPRRSPQGAGGGHIPRPRRTRHNRGPPPGTPRPAPPRPAASRQVPSGPLRPATAPAPAPAGPGSVESPGSPGRPATRQAPWARRKALAGLWRARRRAAPTPRNAKGWRWWTGSRRAAVVALAASGRTLEEGGQVRRRGQRSHRAGAAPAAPKKGRLASPSGNRTPVSRVTGGDTHHYTNEDGGGHPAARPLCACLPTPTPALDAPPSIGARRLPHRTRPQTNVVRHPSSPTARLGADPAPGRPPNTPRAPRPLACQAGIARGEAAPQDKRGCDQEDGRPRRAEAEEGEGEERGVGWGGELPERRARRRPLGARSGLCEGGGARRVGGLCSRSAAARVPSLAHTRRRQPAAALAPGPSQASGDALSPVVRMAERSKALRSGSCPHEQCLALRAVRLRHREQPVARAAHEPFPPGRLPLATPACLRPRTQVAQPPAGGPTTRPCRQWAWPRSPTRHYCSSPERWAEGSPASPGLPPGRPKPGPPGQNPRTPARSLNALPVRQLASSASASAPASPPPARVGPPGRAPGQSSDTSLRSPGLSGTRRRPRRSGASMSYARHACGAHEPPQTPTPPPTHPHPHSRHSTAPHVRTHGRGSVPQPRGIAPTRPGRESHPPMGLWGGRRVAAQGNGGAQRHLPQTIARGGWCWGSGPASSGSWLPRATPAGQRLAAALDQGENAGGA
ncbi:basic proline-rich protein-like [Neovison vison]|uniref:basic proline-rich protein-like n=1 Tax=Neovison vison TaxID=452646 RepID=UPI001CF007A5|nr:basic proline-rich protein-like [Neogale vison]XP_044123746.1 basic proline-rich protein-like [Neogale vison]XP_044123751.1 basic proline-rich protein-like [Neogale vison]